MAVHLTEFNALACVDKCWREAVWRTKEHLRDLFHSGCFSVTCLGDLQVSEETMKKRLERLLRTRGLSIDDVDDVTSWWFNAQLHLQVFCSKPFSGRTFRDISQSCFEHSPVRKYTFLELFPVSGRWCHFRGKIDRFRFHNLGFVRARDMGCCEVCVPSCTEVLRTLACMMEGSVYCPAFCSC
jgi:hypothetical protein